MMKSFLLFLTVFAAFFTLSAEKYFSEAGWLWAGDKENVPIKAYLRREIHVNEDVRKAFFYAFGDKKFSAFFNGRKIELAYWNKFLPPAFGHVKGKGIDLTKLLKKGKNVLAFEMERFKDKRYCYGLILYGEIEYVSGKKELLRSTVREFRASGKFEENWNTVSFDSSRWSKPFYQGDVTLKPWATYGNVPRLYCTPAEYEAFIKYCSGSFPAKRLAAEKKEVKAKIIYRNHLPAVQVNEKILPPFTTTIPHAMAPDRDSLVYETGKRGMHIIRIGFDLAGTNGDYSNLDLAVRRVLSLNPEAYIIIGYRDRPDANWLKKNPDELVKYAVPSKSTAYHNYRANPATPSYASEKFKLVMEKQIRDVARFCLKQPWGHRILGMVNGHGGSGDGMPPGCHSMPDTGKRMTEKFRIFLKEKYKTQEALRNSWGDDKVTFDNAQVPDRQQRWGSGMYLRDTGDPKDRRVLDYYLCYHKEFSSYIRSQMKAVKKYLPGRLAGCFFGYTILGYTPEGSTAFFEEMLRSPDVDFMYATTRGYNLTDGLHRHNHSVFHRYGKLSSVEADIRTHVDPRAEKQWKCKSPEESRATMTKVIANCLFSGTGFHLVPFYSCRRFTIPEILGPIGEGVKIWRRLFNAPPKKENDIAVIFDHDQVWKQGHPTYEGTRPFTDTVTTLPLQALNFSGFPYDLYALEDFLASKHSYRCVIFLNTFEISDSIRAKLLKKIGRPGVTAVWHYAPGLISKTGFSESAMSALTGMKLRCLKKVMPVSAVDNSQKQLAPSIYRSMKIGPRIWSSDADAKVLARYSDRSAAMAEKRLANGSKALFAGIPITSSALWHKILSEAGCRPYTSVGFMVRRNDKLVMLFSFADGCLPPESLVQKGQLDLSGKAVLDLGSRFGSRTVRDLFTHETFQCRSGRITVKSQRPRVWLFETK